MGFADPCLTTWRPRPCCKKQIPAAPACAGSGTHRRLPPPGHGGWQGRLTLSLPITRKPELGALARRHRLGNGRVQVHDWCSYQIAPLGPRAVVIADVFVAEQVLQDKPGVGAALA